MASARDGTTALGGLRFHFLDWGTPGRPPLLLLHGGAQTAHSWDEVAPELAAAAHAFNARRTLENIRERLHHALRRTPDGRWTYKFDPAVFGAADLELEALWEEVRRIRAPTLLVRGAESPILAAATAERFRRELPGCAVAEVSGAGHSVMGDNPIGFVAAVRPFLARHGL